MISRALRTSVLLAAIVLVTQTFVAIGWLRPVVVAGDSMSPTFETGQGIVVRRTQTPRRWDAVVLRSPTDARRLVVKRLVGLPGSRSHCGRAPSGSMASDGTRRPRSASTTGRWAIRRGNWDPTRDSSLGTILWFPSTAATGTTPPACRCGWSSESSPSDRATSQSPGRVAFGSRM